MTKETTKDIATDDAAANNAIPQMPASQVYVDGAAIVGLRAGTVHIDFFDVVGPAPEGKGEVRKLSQRLVMPVGSMVQLHNMLGDAVKAIKEASDKDTSDKDTSKTSH